MYIISFQFMDVKLIVMYKFILDGVKVKAMLETIVVFEDCILGSYLG